MRFISGTPWGSNLNDVRGPGRVDPISTFEVELRHGTRSVRVMAGFDSGMAGAYLEIPSSLARELGIQRLATETLMDSSGSSLIGVGRIDGISIGGESGCSVRNVKTWFFEDAPILVGNDFMREVNAVVTYGAEPSLSCKSGAPAAEKDLRFRILIIPESGNPYATEAFFDTGWESSDLVVPPRVAKLLGLRPLGVEDSPTPTGTYRAPYARVPRVELALDRGCGVDDAKVKIFSFLDRIIIGESFFKKTGGTVGYGPGGAFYRCSGPAEAL